MVLDTVNMVNMLLVHDFRTNNMITMRAKLITALLLGREHIVIK